jgi:hypothetical protein
VSVFRAGGRFHKSSKIRLRSGRTVVPSHMAGNRRKRNYRNRIGRSY